MHIIKTDDICLKCQNQGRFQAKAQYSDPTQDEMLVGMLWQQTTLDLPALIWNRQRFKWHVEITLGNVLETFHITFVESNDLFLWNHCLWPALGFSFKHFNKRERRAEWLTKAVVKGLNKVLSRRWIEKHDLMSEACVIFFRWIHQRSLEVKTFSSQAQHWIVFLSDLSKHFVVWENLSSHYSEISLTEAVTSRQSTIHLWQSAAKLA